MDTFPKECKKVKYAREDFTLGQNRTCVSSLVNEFGVPINIDPDSANVPFPFVMVWDDFGFSSTSSSGGFVFRGGSVVSCHIYIYIYIYI